MTVKFLCFLCPLWQVRQLEQARIQQNLRKLPSWWSDDLDFAAGHPVRGLLSTFRADPAQPAAVDDRRPDPPAGVSGERRAAPLQHRDAARLAHLPLASQPRHEVHLRR